MNWRALPLYKWMEKNNEKQTIKDIVDRGGSKTDTERFNKYVKGLTKAALIYTYIFILLLVMLIIRGWFV